MHAHKGASKRASKQASEQASKRAIYLFERNGGGERGRREREKKREVLNEGKRCSQQQSIKNSLCEIKRLSKARKDRIEELESTKQS